MSFFKTIKSAIGLENETPNYEVLQTLADNIEIRKYPATRWANAKTEITMNETEMRSGISKLFWQLFQYISGNNSDHQKIAMTTPVKMDYKCKNDNKVDNNTPCEMTLSFFVPKEFNDKTPMPDGPNMDIQEIPEMIVAASRFGGYAKLENYMHHRDLILKALGPDQAKNYDSVNLLTAGYDPPFKPILRRNEVWLRKIY